jgi:hypothetical protein
VSSRANGDNGTGQQHPIDLETRRAIARLARSEDGQRRLAALAARIEAALDRLLAERAEARGHA